MLNTQNHFSHLPEKLSIPQFHRTSQSAPADSQYWPFYIKSFYRKISSHFRNRFRVSRFCKKLAKRIILYPNPQHFLKQPEVHLFLKQKDESRNPSELQRHGGSALVIPELPPHSQAGTELSFPSPSRGPIHFVPILLHLCKLNSQTLTCMKSICNILEINSSSGFYRKNPNL